MTNLEKRRETFHKQDRIERERYYFLLYKGRLTKVEYEELNYLESILFRFADY